MATGQQGLAGQGLARGGGSGDHHRLNGGVSEHLGEVGAAGQLRCRHRSGETIGAGMPEGHRFGVGAGPQGLQMHGLTEAEAGDRHTDGSHPSNP